MLVCKGSGCPLRSIAQASAVFHIQQFERELRAGTKLTITVTQARLHLQGDHDHDPQGQEPGSASTAASSRGSRS